MPSTRPRRRRHRSIHHASVSSVAVTSKDLFVFPLLKNSGIVAHVAATATLPVLDCLYYGVQRPPRKTSGKNASSSHENTHTQPRTRQRIESVSVGSYHYDTCTPSQPFPHCLQPFLDGRGVQNAATVGKLNQTRTKSHTAVAPDNSATSEDLQPSAASSTRETDYRS